MSMFNSRDNWQTRILEQYGGIPELWITNRHKTERSWYHIHVDSAVALPEWAVSALKAIGFWSDNFDHDFQLTGKGGDADEAFDHYEPAHHMTMKFGKGDKAAFDTAFTQAEKALKNFDGPFYIEGEFIPYQQEWVKQPFDEQAFEVLFPVVTDGLSFQMTDGSKRQPLWNVLKRRLSLEEKFRFGEVHGTIQKEDADARILELFGHHGFSAPAIPKYLLAKDGKTLECDESGKPQVINEIPFTIQVANAEQYKLLLKHTKALVSVGGFDYLELKGEPIVKYFVSNKIDYNVHMPPVCTLQVT